MISDVVHIDPETFVYIPNTFTPNNDGRNDEFMAQGVGIDHFDMSIFDRWGKLLYYTATMSEPWDGPYQGLPVPLDTYVYRINVINVKGEHQNYLGHVNVVR